MAVTQGYEENSYGLGYPISGKNDGFSHFVWVGALDLESALKRTKEYVEKKPLHIHGKYSKCGHEPKRYKGRQ